MDAFKVLDASGYTPHAEFMAYAGAIMVIVVLVFAYALVMKK